jgi:hypothetical protein
MRADSFTTAFQLHAAGFAVIPSGAGKDGKEPLVKWARYENESPSDVELEAWEKDFHPQLWGIVTNGNVAVIDADGEDTRLELESELGRPHVITPRGGGHWYINTTGKPFKTTTGVLPGVDIRGVGGFVNISGSSALGKYQILTLPLPDSLIPWEKIPGRIIAALNGQRQRLEANEPIPEGQRNDTLASIAGSMRRAGMAESEITNALLSINAKRCQPPLADDEVKMIASSISQYPPNTGNNKNTSIYCPSSADLATERDKIVTENVTKSLAERIEAWIFETTGWFSYEECDKELGIRDSKDKDNRRQIIKRLKDAGLVESHSSHNKLLRHVKVATRLIDFKSANLRTPLAIKYPFGIENYFRTYPRNLVVIAGAADAGKTAFLLNLIRLNMADFSIYYQSSEMGAAELASRLEKFEGIGLEDWNFIAEERSRDFPDIIRPDCLNIMDYLELAGDFYMVADYLKQIHDKLSSGVAVVALQKRRNAELGRGGDFGLEKPRLYLTMDAGKLTIQKAKNWTDPQVNPNNLTLNFKIVNGCKFIVTEDWHKGE